MAPIPSIHSGSASEPGCDTLAWVTMWDDYRARWRPSRNWAHTLFPAVEIIGRDPTSVAAVGAWCEVAMMLGDTHAAPLGLIVCLYAEAAAPRNADISRLRAHRDLCLLDLGLARSRKSGPIPVKDLGSAEMVNVQDDALDRWLNDQLVPFGGDLASAAQAVLALAIAKVSDPLPDP